MSKVSITKEKLDTLAEAVGAKSGENLPLTIDQMTSAVLGIELVNNQEKTIVPTKNRQYVTPDTSYTGLEQVIVEPINDAYIIPSGERSIVENGTFNIRDYESVYINVPIGSTINNQDKTVIPTSVNLTVTADSGYTGLGTITVVGDPRLRPEYIKSGITIFNVEGTYSTPNAIIDSLTVTPGESTQTFQISNLPSISASRSKTGDENSGETVWDIDLSSLFSNGDIFVITGELGAYSSGRSYCIASINEKFIWDNQPHTYYYTATDSHVTNYTTSYTLTINPTNITTIITDTSMNNPPIAKTLYIQKGTPYPQGYGPVTVEAVPTESKTVTENGTVTPSSGKFLSSVIVNVPVGDTINNQNKSVTPTKSQQSITADSGYTGLGTVTVNAIPAAYITTSDADAVAANILLNKTAYVNGSKITGSMANNGTTGGIITEQGGIYTIPAGYTSGGTVSANITASTITNTALNVASFEETTGDYGVRASITIPAGYYNQTTLTKDLSTVLPAPDTAIAENQMLAGYQAYNNEGELLTGTMTNNAAWSRTLDQTTTSVTIPAGYHSGTGTVSHTTVNIPDPNITVSAAGLITASGSWTRGFTTDNSYSKTQQLTTQAAKTVTPTESEQTAVAAGVYTTGIVKIGAISSTYVGSGITTRDSDDLTVSGGTVTAPAGYYSAAASKSVASMTLPTTTSTSATSGATRKATIDRSTSTRYINIPVGYNDTVAYYQISAVANGSVTAPSSISGTAATVSTGTNTLTLTKSVSVTPNVTTAGYISSGTAGNSNVTLTANVTTKAAATITPSTTNQTIASGTYLTGTQTITGDADLVAGNIKSGVNIFGVNGTFTSDATAGPTEILDGATAYVDGELVTGTVVVNRYYTGSTAPSSSLGNNGDIYLQQ